MAIAVRSLQCEKLSFSILHCLHFQRRWCQHSELLSGVCLGGCGQKSAMHPSPIWGIDFIREVGEVAAGKARRDVMFICCKQYLAETGSSG